MAYGDNEYGTVPYGDDTIIARLIRITKELISILFISKSKVLEFLSEKKNNIFKSDGKDLIKILFIAKSKALGFLSERKKNIFKSDDT